MPCRIELLESEVYLKVGCTDEERAVAQPILISASVESPTYFPASETDALNGTIDAARLRMVIFEQAQAQSVRTLERLGAILEGTLRRQFSERGLKWELRITKPRFGWAYVHSWTT